MTAPLIGRWWSVPAPLPAPRLRLFCFPHAGAGASCFFPWAATLRPHAIEVCAIQLPGRENRLLEIPFTHIDPLVESLAGAIEPFLRPPFCFFGHSLGTLVSFELMRRLRARGAPLPRHVFMSGRHAPQVPRAEETLSALPDLELIQQVATRYGGIPKAVLQHRELVDVIVPALRADLTVLETYEYHDAAPFDCAITAYAGRQDPHVEEAVLARWKEHTTGGFSAVMFPGDHFFLQQDRAALIAAMSPALLAAID